MQKLPGTLKVEHVMGRRGRFSAGTLETSMGTFKVSDAALDQFEPGTYDGEFLVTRIYYKTSQWRNGLFVSLMAEIATNGYLIASADESPAEGAQVPPAQAEPDMAEPEHGTAGEPATATQFSKKSKVARDAGSTLNGQQQTATIPADLEGLQDLFGIEIAPQVQARASAIALDAAIEDRFKFRKQRDCLKELGYRFQVANQTWYLPDSNQGEGVAQ